MTQLNLQTPTTGSPSLALYCSCCDETTTHIRLEGEWICNNYHDH